MELRAAKRFRPREDVRSTRSISANPVGIQALPTNITSNSILDAVCAALSLEHEDIISRSHKKSTSQARFIVIGLTIRQKSKTTLKRLGALLNRNHSTIIYGKQLFNNLYQFDKEFKIKVDKVVDLLSQ